MASEKALAHVLVLSRRSWQWHSFLLSSPCSSACTKPIWMIWTNLDQKPLKRCYFMVAVHTNAARVSVNAVQCTAVMQSCKASAVTMPLLGDRGSSTPCLRHCDGVLPLELCTFLTSIVIQRLVHCIRKFWDTHKHTERPSHVTVLTAMQIFIVCYANSKHADSFPNHHSNNKDI